MPSYTYKCNNQECLHEEIKIMSISEFKELKKSNLPCPECEKGILKRKLGKIRNKINKSSKEFMQDIAEDTRKTIEKIRSGNEQAAHNFFGEKVHLSEDS